MILSLLIAPSALAADISVKEAPRHADISRSISAEKGALTSRIVGGGPVSIASYPWQVSLALNPEIFPNPPYQRHFCGGALVTPTVIVSAAHCFYNSRDDDFYPAREHTAIVNRSYLNSSSGEEIEFARYFYFVDEYGLVAYDPYTKDYDVVIIELERPVAQAQTISIAGSDESALWSAGREASASGWGATREGGAASNQLQAVGINILPDWACGAYWTYDANLQLCAGRITGEKDTCQGDSGGPLTVSGADGVRRLVGLTSYGEGCARARRPGVYARVASPNLAEPIAAAFKEHDFGNPFASGAVPQDKTAAVITGFPGKNSRLGRKKSRQLSFSFFASEPGSSFFCQLYKNGRLAYGDACASPFSRKYRAGRYYLRVSAVKEGDQSAAPATYRFRVRK